MYYNKVYTKYIQVYTKYISKNMKLTQQARFASS